MGWTFLFLKHLDICTNMGQDKTALRQEMLWKEGRKAGYPTTSWCLSSSISSTGSSSSSTSSTSIGWLGCLAHLLVHRVANLDIFICRSCPRKRPCLWYLPSQFVGQSMQKKDGTCCKPAHFQSSVFQPQCHVFGICQVSVEFVVQDGWNFARWRCCKHVHFQSSVLSSHTWAQLGNHCKRWMGLWPRTNPLGNQLDRPQSLFYIVQSP